jgi:hypothetical protein
MPAEFEVRFHRTSTRTAQIDDFRLGLCVPFRNRRAESAHFIELRDRSAKHVIEDTRHRSIKHPRALRLVVN